MPRAAISVDFGTPEQAVVAAWFKRWQGRLAFCSKNEGCGCCVDHYRVDAPREALDELPPAVLGCSDWPPCYGATNSVIMSAAETGLGKLAELEKFGWFKNCAPSDFTDQDVGELRTLYLEGDELWTFRAAQDQEGFALVRQGMVVGAAVVSASVKQPNHPF